MSKAILNKEELIDHLSNVDNHYLYRKEDDGSITCYMCCDFDVVESNEIVFSGSCGNGINFDPLTKELRRV